MCMKAEAFLSVRSAETKRLARRVLCESNVSVISPLGVRESSTYWPISKTIEVNVLGLEKIMSSSSR